MATLINLPNEILHDIASRLLVPDQASLAGTCKPLHEQLTPIVWREIELHHRGVHEGLVISQLIDEYADDGECHHQPVSEKYPFGDCTSQPSNRKYAQCEVDRETWRAHAKERERRMIDLECDRESEPEQRATYNCNRKTYQYGREEIFLGTRARQAPSRRWAELSCHVQSLCLSIAVDEEVCSMLADLLNLRSLQLVGLPLAKEWENSQDVKATNSTGNTLSPPLPSMNFPALRNLRLRGYIPTNLVRAILASNAPHITHLDLGLLAGPREDGANPILYSYNDDLNDDDSEDDNEDEEEDEDEKTPWALHSPHWLQGEPCLPSPLSSLTHLRLVKPYNGEVRSSIWTCDSFDPIPDEYDEVIYKEWGTILDSAAGTLKEAIFEQRVAMEAGDTVGDGDPIPETKGSEFRTEPDTADTQFCETILRRLLLGGSAEYPHLQRLALRGIRIRRIRTLAEEVDGDAIPGDLGVPSNTKRLRAAFPACDVELFEPAYPVYVYAGYVYQDWPSNRHEAGQDAGDGLLYNEFFFNDYRRRFGPDWRISD